MTSAAQPFFSVVIPAYNVARYLARSVGSVQSQTFRDFELIVVDDGSNDDPKSVVDGVAPGARCIVFPANKGLSAARNAGIEAAVGEYVALLDADDYWEPDRLAYAHRLLSGGRFDVAFSDFAHVMPDGSPGQWQGGLLARLRGWGLRTDEVGPYCHALHGEITYELIRRTSYMHPSTVAIRRSVFDGVGLFNEQLRAVEDLEMWIRLATRCSFGYVDRVLARIEQRADSLKHDDSKMSQFMIRVYESVPAIVSDLPPSVRVAVNEHLATQHSNLGWSCLQRGDVAESRRQYWSSLRYAPSIGRMLRLAKTYLPAAVIASLRSARSALSDRSRT